MKTKLKYYLKISFYFICIIIIPINNSRAQTSKEKKNYFFLDSDMDSVSVFINDSLVGVTPLKLKNFPSGIYNIDFVYDTLVIHKYGVYYQNDKYYDEYAIFKKGKGLITVLSDVANSSVFLNDSLIGYTPLIKKYIDKGVYSLSIRLDNEIVWKRRINIHSRLYKFKALTIGYLKINENNNKVKYYIDDKLVKNNLHNLIKLKIGEHIIGVKSSNYHKDFNELFNIASKEIKSVQFKYGVKTFKPLLYSALVPGLGQITDNSKPEGYIIMGTNLFLAGAAVYLSSNYNSKLDEYKKSIFLYEKEKDIGKVLKYKRQMLADYDNAQTALKIKKYSIAVFLVSYLYNLVDAYLNHSLGGEFIFSTTSDLKTSNLILKVRL